MIILSSFAFPHKQKMSSSSSSSSYASKTSKLSSDLLKLTICRRRPKNLYRKPPHFWMISRFAFMVNRNVNDVMNLASRDNQLTSINKYHSSLIDYNQHCTKAWSSLLLWFSHTKIMHRIPTRSCPDSEAKMNHWIININRKDFMPRNKSTASSVSLCY